MTIDVAFFRDSVYTLSVKFPMLSFLIISIYIVCVANIRFLVVRTFLKLTAEFFTLWNLFIF